MTEAEGVTFPYANRATSLVSLVLNLTRLQTRVGEFKLHSPGPASTPRPASMPLAPACWVNAPAYCICTSDPARWVTGQRPRMPGQRWSAPPPLCAGSMPPASAHWVSVPRSAHCVDVVLVLVPVIAGTCTSREDDWGHG